MRAKAKKTSEAEVSPIENQYRRWFQQTVPDEAIPFINDVPQHPIVITKPPQTYTTYGAYEKPIELKD